MLRYKHAGARHGASTVECNLEVAITGSRAKSEKLLNLGFAKTFTFLIRFLPAVNSYALNKRSNRGLVLFYYLHSHHYHKKNIFENIICKFWKFLQICNSFSLTVGGYVNNSLRLARKYSRILVRGHYLL